MSGHAKDIVARAMYEKGKAFLGACILVEQKRGNPSVVLHLLCQGIEIVLKAVLLAHDYNVHKPRLVKLGHNLVRIAASARQATGLHVFTHGAQVELAGLSTFYSLHVLRYASNFDIFIDASTIPYRRVARHAFALVRYCEKARMFSTDWRFVRRAARPTSI
jgi:hypothetical protein